MRSADKGLAPGREIYCVDLSRERAEDAAALLREQGRHPHVHKRLVRAEGIDMIGFVVVVDKKAQP